MATIVAYTRKYPIDTGVETDLYTDDDGSQCIMIRTFEGPVHGIHVLLDANQADMLATNLMELVAQMRSDS